MMKVKQVLPFFCMVILIICSCRMDVEDLSQDPDNNVVLDTPPRLFWAFNYRTSQYYQITANLYADGRHCRIWVEKGTNVTSATANSVANIFDRMIYPKMMVTFSTYGPMTVNGEIIANNTMELADWLGDGDGKLAILLMDIQDSYMEGANESRTAGYFSRLDLESGPYSNKADMLYIDSNPETPGSSKSNRTIAHEMQHLMNYVTSILYRNGYEMDLWINEGLSAIAEWIYEERHSEDRWVYYNADPSGLIQRGNNFFIWGNHTDEHHYAELDDYATVYLFFHWLRLQTGSNAIFTNLIKSREYSYHAVTQAADNAMQGAGYGDWGTLLRTWLAANYINASTGPYGYENDNFLKRIKAKTMPEGMLNVLLYPGEAVYSITKAGFPWPNEEKNIKYAGLNSRSPWINNEASFDGGALLTYNINPNRHGYPEEGRTSGIASNIDTTLYERRIRTLLSQRTVIDVSSLLGQNSHDETPDPAMTGVSMGIIKLE